jgi:hypothetical protein
MGNQFTVPEEYEASFRRILPYLMAPLQINSKTLESLLLFLKLGGEKMARIAIDALNVTQRLHDAEVKKQLREQELLNDNEQGDLDDDEDENVDDNEEKDADADGDDLDDASD